jgi:hypothetical protein
MAVDTRTSRRASVRLLPIPARSPAIGFRLLAGRIEWDCFAAVGQIAVKMPPIAESMTLFD